MAELANNTAPNNGAPASTGAPAGGQPATFSVPEGHRLVPIAEYESHARNTERLKGMDGFYKKASSLGFKSDKDFETWEPAFKAFQKRGVKPDLLAKTFGDEPTEDHGHRQDTTAFDPNEFKQTFKGELRKELALESWREGYAAEKDVVSKVVSDLESEAPYRGSVLRRVVEHALDHARGDYPENHPLHGEVLPYLTEKHAKGVIETLKKEWAEDKAKSTVDKADALKKAQNKTPTVAGPATRQGKPDTKNDSRPDGRPSRESIEDMYEALKAKRAGMQ